MWLSLSFFLEGIDVNYDKLSLLQRLELIRPDPLLKVSDPGHDLSLYFPVLALRPLEIDSL